MLLKSNIQSLFSNIQRNRVFLILIKFFAFSFVLLCGLIVGYLFGSNQILSDSDRMQKTQITPSLQNNQTKDTNNLLNDSQFIDMAEYDVQFISSEGGNYSTRGTLLCANNINEAYKMFMDGSIEAISGNEIKKNGSYPIVDQQYYFTYVGSDEGHAVLAKIFNCNYLHDIAAFENIDGKEQRLATVGKDFRYAMEFANEGIKTIVDLMKESQTSLPYIQKAMLSHYLDYDIIKTAKEEDSVHWIEDLTIISASDCKDCPTVAPRKERYDFRYETSSGNLYLRKISLN